MAFTMPPWGKNRHPHLARMLWPLTITTGLALFIGLFFGLYTRPRLPDALHVFCDANGNVNLMFNSLYIRFFARNIYWDPNFFLAINLGFGSFSFAVVRIIDGFWDVCVARGGQGALAILAYSVLRRSFDVHIRRHATGLPLFASLAFDKVSFTFAWRAFQDSVRQTRVSQTRGKPETSGTGSKKSRIWRYLSWLLVTAFVLAFPTLTSLISGYQPRYEPYLNPPNSNVLIPLAPFRIPYLLFNDWDKVGFSGPVAFDLDSKEFHNLTLYFQTCYEAIQPPFNKETQGRYPREDTCPDNACSCTIDVAQNRWLDGTVVPNITASKITINERTWSLDRVFSFQEQCGAGDGQGPCLDEGPVFLTDGKLTLSSDYIADHGFCRPIDRYQWGFSSLALLTHLLISLVIAAILTALHFDALRNERPDAHAYDGNVYADVLTVYDELDRLQLNHPLRQTAPAELKEAARTQQLVRFRHDPNLRLRAAPAPSYSSQDDVELQQTLFSKPTT